MDIYRFKAKKIDFKVLVEKLIKTVHVIYISVSHYDVLLSRVIERDRDNIYMTRGESDEYAKKIVIIIKENVLVHREKI